MGDILWRSQYELLWQGDELVSMEINHLEATPLGNQGGKRREAIVRCNQHFELRHCEYPERERERESRLGWSTNTSHPVGRLVSRL